MKKIKLFILLVGLSLVCNLQTANAYLYATNAFYDPIEDSFTVQVKTTEPWVLWRTFDMVNWDPVSLVLPATVFQYTDMDVDAFKAWYLPLPPNVLPFMVGFDITPPPTPPKRPPLRGVRPTHR